MENIKETVLLDFLIGMYESLFSDYKDAKDDGSCNLEYYKGRKVQLDMIYENIEFSSSPKISIIESYYSSNTIK